MAFDLLQRIQQHAHHDQQRGSTEELRKALLHPEHDSERWHDGYEAEEDGPWQGDP